MPKLMHTLAFAVTLGFTMASGAIASGNALQVPTLRYRFKMRWRLGAPSFAYEYFPRFERRKPVVFVGKMAPRGILILRATGDTKSTPESMRRVLRGKGVDITPCVQIAGAHYRKPGEKMKVVYVPPEKLPDIKVQYEPLLPEQITIPGKQNCVLLFQIGEGKEGEWAEGHWSVSVRFDPGKMNVRLAPAGTGAVHVRTKDGRVTAVYRFNFIAKKIKTKADRHNWLYYHYRDLEKRMDQKKRAQAVEPLGELIKAYPTDPNLLNARANLLGEQERYAEAVKDAKRIQELLKKGTLRTAFHPLGTRGRLTTAEAVAWLEGKIAYWNRKAVEKEKGNSEKTSSHLLATRPAKEDIKELEDHMGKPRPEGATTVGRKASQGKDKNSKYAWITVAIGGALILGVAIFLVFRRVCMRGK